jgi:hypothetical protein
MGRPKIAIILRTVGLEYDDRVRKECIELSKIADLKIFVTFENNEEKEGVTSYGIPYKSFRLKTRELIPSGRLLIVKAFEFYFRVKKYLKGYDLYWAHEEYTFLFPLLGAKGTYIWDMHEIPHIFMKKPMRKVFGIIERKSKGFIHANNERIKYLIGEGMISQPEKHSAIRNYPDTAFLQSQKLPENYETFTNWLNDRSYVYLQGLTVADRFPYNSIASILEATHLCVVVIGTFEDLESLNRLKETYGATLDQRVFFAGRVNQLSIPSFLKNASFSIVLYNIDDPNNRYCEANRFYQAINYGIPVITGCNETMSGIVNDKKLGISIAGDGRDVNELIAAIRELLRSYAEYRANAEKFGGEYVWEKQQVNYAGYIG